VAALPGMELVLDRSEGCRRFELPPDRMGDLIAVSRRHYVIGTSLAKHDLSGLDAPCAPMAGSRSRRCRSCSPSVLASGPRAPTPQLRHLRPRPQPRPVIALPSQAHVVIVGGGIVGASVAYHLTTLGLRDVVLLEQGSLSAGPRGMPPASWASSAPRAI